MAQLKDSIITGSLRVTDTIFSTNLNLSSLTASQAVITDADKNLISRSIDDATSNGALGTGTGLTTERSVYYGLVTVNNASQTRATGIYAPTSAGTANQILVSSGGTSAPTWKATAAGAAYATSNNGALTFGTLGAGYGGTGQSTYTIGDILYSNAANTLTKLNGNTTTTNKFLRSVATTSGTAVAPTWSEVTKTDVGLSNVTNDAQVKASLGTAKGDMLYWSANATPARLAIGTAGYTLQATADGPAWTEKVAVANGGTGATSFTANSAIISGSTTTSALTTRAITNNTTAGSNPTANTNLITANTLINYKGTANIDTLGTITTGTWNGSTIAIANGGTGATTAPKGFEALTCRGVVNNTVTSLDDIKAAGYYWVRTDNTPNGWPSEIPTGTQYGLLEVISSNSESITIQRLNMYNSTRVYSRLWANGVWASWYHGMWSADHYISGTQISINLTSAPHSGYTLLVNGHSEVSGALSLQQPNSSTQSLYFKNHTSTVLGVGARIYYWNGSASGITHSQLNFQEYSYSTTASATPLSYYEQYSLPDCTAGLSANASYSIITTKNLNDIPNVVRSHQVPSSTANFDAMTTAGVYDVINNITNGYPGTSGSNPKYGTLLVFTTHRGPSGSSGNVVVQVYYGNTPNSDQNQYLYIRAKYASNWKKWHQVTLTKLSV